MRCFPLLLVSAVAGFVCGCSSSSTSTTMDAGHPHEASTAKDTGKDVAKEVTHDAGTDAKHDATSDAKADAPFDAGHDASDGYCGYTYDGPVYTLEAGTTWSSLYRDYFGNLKTAGCAGDGVCHGSPSQQGAAASYFVCPAIGDAGAAQSSDAGDAGDDASPDAHKASPGSDTCYSTLTSADASTLITPNTTFSNDGLSFVLCTTGTNEGVMPQAWSVPAACFKDCNYLFTPTDLARIAAWVEAGAPNN